MGTCRTTRPTRSKLASPGSTTSAAGGVPLSDVPWSHATPPDEQHPNGSRTWWTRSEAMVIAYTAPAPATTLAVDVDAEYAVLVLDGTAARSNTAASRRGRPRPSVVDGAAGCRRRCTLDTAGTVVRVFAAATAPELAARCANAADYAAPDANVAEFAAWPDPPDGHRVRVYPLSEYPYEDRPAGRDLPLLDGDDQRVRRGRPTRVTRASSRPTTTTTSSRSRCRSPATTCTTCACRGRPTSRRGATTSTTTASPRRWS